MNKLKVLVMISSLVTTSVFAEDYCSRYHMTWNGTKCITVGAGLGSATVSGIYSAKKYSRANSIEKEFTLRAYEHSAAYPGDDLSSVNRSSSSFTDGDRITITYNLSEIENRQYHIDLMEQRASTSRSLAISYGAQALTATKTEYDTVYNSDGSTTSKSRTVPDYAARASYAAMALREEANAREYIQKAHDARNGGPVPTYDLEKVVDSDKGTARQASDFNKERLDRGGKILKIDRLPVEKFRMFKSAVNKARGGLVGVAVGAGLAAEEAIEGAAARRIDQSEYSPAQLMYQDDYQYNSDGDRSGR
jgi:phosphopantetheine adenylyltransferase